MKRTSFLIKLILLPAIIISFIRCVPEPELAPMQKRQLTTKLFECSYENTYRAALTVLQDQGYIIKNTDMASGLILASVDRETPTGDQIAQYLLVGFEWSKGTEIEVSCVVNKLSNTSSEIRINIQEVKYGQSSWLSGTSKQSSKQIYEPRLYQNIFNQITLEIKRREAINGVEPSDDLPSEGRQQTAKAEKASAIKGQNLIIHLKDGSIIKGEVTSYDDGSIILRTSLGEITLDRKLIAGIEEIVEQVSITLNDGTIISGKLITQDDKIVTIGTSLGVLKIEKTNIRKIEKQKLT